MANGFGPMTWTVPLCDGVDFDLVLPLGAGSNSSEITFDVIDPYGNALISGGTTASLPATCTASCAPATCPDPAGLSAANITDVSADISWTDVAASGLSNVEYGVAGFTLGSGTVITGTTNTTESLSGLTASTTYEFYVQSDCGTGIGTSAWVGPFAFTTNCDAANQCTYTF
jgi:hypothetical protein